MKFFIISFLIISFSLILKAESKWSFPNHHRFLVINQKDSKAKSTSYKSLDKVSEPWKICVLMPNAMDKFWWSVSYGVFQAQEHLKVNLVVLDSGGYNNIENQVSQINKCLELGMQALVIAATSTKGIEEALKNVHAKKIPIIDLVNDLHLDFITAHAVVRTGLHGKYMAEHLNKLKFKNKKTVAWFPGPEDANWSIEMNAEFLKHIDQEKFNVIKAGFADVNPSVQRTLIEALADKNKVDIFLGNAVLAELAAKLFTKDKAKKSHQVFSTYYSPDLDNYLLDNSIDATVTNFPVLLGYLGVDLASKILEKKPHPYMVGPVIVGVDKRNVKQLNSFISYPSQFRYYLKNSF